jgi:nucleotide-binding universal stress UspA family protein
MLCAAAVSGSAAAWDGGHQAAVADPKMDRAGASGFERGADGPTPSLLVVGLDGSDTSWRALHYAFGLARRQHGAVVAVFAFMPVTSWDGTSAGAWYAGAELAAELRAAVAALAREHRVDAEFVSAQRDPVRSLIEVAAERRADAIIVGASKALSHKLFGSKAVRTIRRSRCPVIVVP